MRKLIVKNVIGSLVVTAIMLFNTSAAMAQPEGGKKMKQHQKVRMEKLKTELNLSADQVAKIEGINKEAHEKIKVLKEKHKAEKDALKAEMKAIRQEKKSKMEAVLTPEQRDKMAKMKEDVKKENKGKHKKRNGKNKKMNTDE